LTSGVHAERDLEQATDDHDAATGKIASVRCPGA
jgi:hypothetical protein